MVNGPKSYGRSPRRGPVTRPMRSAGIAAAVLLASITPAPAQDEAIEVDDSTQSALFLLEQSTRVRNSGEHHVLQRALRQLRDPELQPFFSFLADGPHADLQIHGILGLAEASPQRQIDMVRIAAIKSPAIQADLISHAMDNDLLSAEQAVQMLQWEQGVDLAVKILIAAHLIGDGSFDQPDIIAEAIASENLARRSLAALLMLQTGDAGAMDVLEELDASEDKGRESVRGMLLRTASKFEFDKAAAWALGVANDPDADDKVSLAALHVALKFGADGADDAWRRRFNAADGVGARTRLALMALQLSDQLPATTGRPLRGSEEPLIKQIGATMTAIQSGVDVADEVIKLIQFKHPRAAEWALLFAREKAGNADAVRILSALIIDLDGPSRNRELRLDQAMAATQLLYEKDPDAATAFLRPLLESPDTAQPLKQGVLFGLIRCEVDTNAYRVIESLGAFDRPRTRGLALLLLAKHTDRLSEKQLEHLGLLVRGGGMRGPLRVQAAWRYLRMTDQVEMAFARVMEH